MRAADVMTRKVVAVAPETSVGEAASLMLKNRVGGLPVVDLQGKVIGLVSDGDLMRRADLGTERHRSWWLELIVSNAERARDFEKARGLHVRNVMTSGAVTVPEDASVAEVAEILESRHIKRVPVVRDGRLVGIVSRADLMRALTTSPLRPPSADARDTELEKAVLAELGRQDWLSVTPSSIEVSHGVVRIWGKALSDEELKAVTVAAETVPGVRKVLNYMEVAPGASFPVI